MTAAAVKKAPSKSASSGRPAKVAPATQSAINKTTNSVWSRIAIGATARIAVAPPDTNAEHAADNIAQEVAGEPRHRSTTAAAVPHVSSDTQERLEHPGSGEPVDPAIREPVERSVGQELQQARIHSTANDRATADALGARAFAFNNHIFVGSKQSVSDRQLMAHELAHVAAPITNTIQRDPADASAQTGRDWKPMQVSASGIDDGAKLLGALDIDFGNRRTNVFIGMHPKFIKVYDHTGKSLGKKLLLKELQDMKLNAGVYLEGPTDLVALDVSTDQTQVRYGSRRAIIWHRPYTVAEKAAIKEEAEAAKAEKRQPKIAPVPSINLEDHLVNADEMRKQVDSIPNAQVIYFVPKYDLSSDSGKGNNGSKSKYSSPIEGRADGQPANFPPWPVKIDGPTLVPVDSDPTYSAQVDWTANGNDSLASQVISQLGETIHYKWELFDITKYARELIAKDPASTADASSAAPEKTLQQRIDEFTASARGSGTDVTGTGGARREFRREFEDWWKDTKRASRRAQNPDGDSSSERLSNRTANLLTIQLAPVSLLVTSLGAVGKLLADLFAGPRQQQEIPLEKQGIFLIRVITTPAVHDDRHGNPIIRPPSVFGKVTEVATMERAVDEALDEPGAKLAELQSQIDVAEKEGNTSKSAYLRALLADAKETFEGSTLALITKKRDQKQADLEEYRKKYPNLSTYSRQNEVDALNDQIALYNYQEQQRTAGTTGLAALNRVNATLISEVTGEKYPLLLSAGPMAMDGAQYQWMLSDVTNRDADAFVGRGETPSAALQVALERFGARAAYGRGTIGIHTEGLGLEATAPKKLVAESAAADWALAQKRLDDLVTTLAALGLVVASAGTAAALIGAGVAAARLIQRWRAGHLYLDAQTMSDALGVLGGLGASGQFVAGLRLQKFEKVFALVGESSVTDAQFAKAATILEAVQGVSQAAQTARIVELANEAINYAGLIWGNVSFIEEMIKTNELEAKGAITHAAARRSRATAISSAVQNNGLFIAGNVLKAKSNAAKMTGGATEPVAHETKPVEVEHTDAPPRDPAPAEITSRDPPSAKTGAHDEPSTPAEPSVPKVKAPTPDALPLSERRATPRELREALPRDLRSKLTVDSSLEGDTAHAEFTVDKASGLISDIWLVCGPDARPATVALHSGTMRTMQKYQGFSGRVRKGISWVAEIFGITTLDPTHNKSFEAALEIRKLPPLIEAQMLRMKKMEPNARDMAEAELESLIIQLERHLQTLDIGDTSEGAGHVAAKGVSKAKRQQYSELLARLRKEVPGEDAHMEIRREMYELVGGDMPRDRWETVYHSNTERAKKATVVVDAEHSRLGWGDVEKTVSTKDGEARRLDIADPAIKKGIEVKAYETEYIAATEEIISEVLRDGKLVKPGGWEITWILIDTQPTAPLRELLLKNGIVIEFRTLKFGPVSELVYILRPPVRKGK